MIKVMICDDMEDIRSYLENNISAETDMEVVGVTSSGEESVQCAIAKQPHVILMDVQMEEENAGILATSRIMEALPNTKIIMLTIHNQDDLIVDAYMAGAIDYMLKDSDKEVICRTIRRVYENEDFIGKRISTALRGKIMKTKKQEISMVYLINNMIKLTPTEQMILEQLYRKKKRKEIAEKNFMSEETVKIHIRHILRKLDFTSTQEMVDFLNKMGIMEIFKPQKPL